MQKYKNNYKIIYSLRLHMALQEMGIINKGEMRNPMNQKLNCWIYERTPELSQAMKDLMEGGF